MVKASVASLKAELSHYLELVKTGEQVLVTSHGKEIAKIGPVQAASTAPIHWGHFLKSHPLIKPRRKDDVAAILIRKIRDEY